MSRRDGRSGDAYFINKILAPCPYEFAKIDGVWHKRKIYKRKKVPWEEVVFSEDSAALDTESII